MTLGSDLSYLRPVSASATLYLIQQILVECLLSAKYSKGTLLEKPPGLQGREEAMRQAKDGCGLRCPGSSDRGQVILEETAWERV